MGLQGSFISFISLAHSSVQIIDFINKIFQTAVQFLSIWKYLRDIMNTEMPGVGAGYFAKKDRTNRPCLKRGLAALIQYILTSLYYWLFLNTFIVMTTYPLIS